MQNQIELPLLIETIDIHQKSLKTCWDISSNLIRLFLNFLTRVCVKTNYIYVIKNVNVLKKQVCQIIQDIDIFIPDFL